MEINSVGIISDSTVEIINTPYSEMKRIFLELFDLNFPKIKSNAQEIADNRINEFLKSLELKFSENIKKIQVEKFSDPNIQYYLQKTAVEVARKGERANYELLGDLLIAQLRNHSVDLIDNILDHALELAPKLLPKHIHYLSFRILINEATSNESDANKLNEMIGLSSERFLKARQICRNDIMYLTGLGVTWGVSEMPIQPSKFRIPIFSKIEYFQKMSIKDLVKYCNENELSSIEEFLNIQLIDKSGVDLTAVGRLIGWLNLNGIENFESLSSSFIF